MAAVDAALNLHPDRLLPPEREERAIARRLYEAVRDLPVISPHGHVESARAARQRSVPRSGDAVRHA
ncbi:MAG TPA: hypothetical protein VNC17_07620 [Thermoleophilaceae bacterium]|nr:hypothetical protein [Thermoleophilaceae bacterium]